MSFICTADLHLSHLVPICRRETPEEWIEHQRKILSFISNTCNVSGSDLYIAGDVFDKSVVSEEVVNMFLDFVNSISGRVVIAHGNHDLRNRSKSTHDTSFGIVERAYFNDKEVAVDAAICKPYTDIPVSDWRDWYAPFDIVTVHTLCYLSKEEAVFGGCSAQELLDKITGPLFIIVGDQHHGFHYEKGGRHVINCGCVLKRSVDFKENVLNIWHVDKDVVTSIPLPPDNGVFNEHRVEIKDREERVTILMEKLANSTNGVSVDFVKNLLMGLTAAGMSEYTESIIRDLVEVEK